MEEEARCDVIAAENEVRRLQRENQVLRQQIDALTARMKRHEATADQLKSYTMQQRQGVGKSKI